MLTENYWTSLPAGLFSGNTNLADLYLDQNFLSSFPADVSGLTDLERLNLGWNDLSSLPAGLFSDLTKLTYLDLRRNNPDPLPLTVTVEKVGADKARARVLAAAPFDVDIPVAVANGALADAATALSVAAGSVDSAAVTLTRTDGTTEAVTVDVDLTIQPTLPSQHRGYEFVRARSGLPAEILPAPARVTSVVVASAPQSGDTYRSYETIVFTVTFSEPVRVTPGRLRLEVGLDNPGGASGSTVEAVFWGQSKSERPTADTPQVSVSRHMHFEYKVKLFDRDADGVRIGANALRLAAGARIQGELGGDAEFGPCRARSAVRPQG